MLSAFINIQLRKILNKVTTEVEALYDEGYVKKNGTPTVEKVLEVANKITAVLRGTQYECEVVAEHYPQTKAGERTRTEISISFKNYPTKSVLRIYHESVHDGWDRTYEFVFTTDPLLTTDHPALASDGWKDKAIPDFDGHTPITRTVPPIQATTNHFLLTADGWKRAGDVVSVDELVNKVQISHGETTYFVDGKSTRITHPVWTTDGWKFYNVGPRLWNLMNPSTQPKDDRNNVPTFAKLSEEELKAVRERAFEASRQSLVNQKNETLEKYHPGIAELAIILNHEIIGVNLNPQNEFYQTPRFKPNDLIVRQVRKYKISFDELRSDWMSRLEKPKTERFTLEEYMKFYMNMGYTVGGFDEIFGSCEASDWYLHDAIQAKDSSYKNYTETPIQYVIRKHKGKVLKI